MTQLAVLQWRDFLSPLAKIIVFAGRERRLCCRSYNDWQAAPFHPDDGKIGTVADIAMPSPRRCAAPLLTMSVSAVRTASCFGRSWSLRAVLASAAALAWF
jgi:hypothetical protein